MYLYVFTDDIQKHIYCHLKRAQEGREIMISKYKLLFLLDLNSKSCPVRAVWKQVQLCSNDDDDG